MPTHVSLKPSGLGSELSWEIAGEQIERVVKRAEDLGAFVRIDMEDATTIDKTLSLYRDLRGAGHERLGIVLQARLWRTAGDVETLADLKPNVRLCKGIYLEPPHIGMQDRDAIRHNYSHLLRRLLANGSFVAVATHDEELIVDALEALQTFGIGTDGYEFQALLGVRPDIAQLLARDHTVRIYVPYGPDSYAYAQRRLRENPQIAGYVARKTLHDMATAVHHSR
ncbi:MAG: proline dehydrogenase family protein [Thermoleophilia bacterium]